MQAIKERLNAYPAFVAPLSEAARRYLAYSSNLEDDGEIQVGHRPWVATLNYMVTLYPGIPADDLDRYADRFDLAIPKIYAEFLKHVNGAFAFGMSLCGVPRSMMGTPPLLDRSRLRCHDLATAATLWIHEYRVPEGWFHFGGRHYSYHENVGYFFAEDERIVSIRGKKKVVGEWTSFTDFLREELPASEALEETLHPAKWGG